MNTERNEAVARLIEYGKAAAALADVATDRDERIWDAHQAQVSKAEIQRLTGLSWATVDRVVRDMAEKHQEG
jgi:hypothetical protein